MNRMKRFPRFFPSKTFSFVSNVQAFTVPPLSCMSCPEFSGGDTSEHFSSRPGRRLPLLFSRKTFQNVQNVFTTESQKTFRNVQSPNDRETNAEC
jgi:hypothetical protein